MSKQTAVDILYNFLYEMESFEGFDPYDFYQKDVFKKLKEIEEKNLKDAFVAGAGMGEMFNNENRCFVSDADKYYKETFKSE